MKIALIPPLVALLFGALASAQTITVVGVDEETNDSWRTTDVAKPFTDADNIYGTDGYFIAQYPDGDPNNVSEPAYATIALVPGRGYEGAGDEAHQSLFDDVLASGAGPVADLVAGDYFVSTPEPSGTEHDFFTITLTAAGTFRLGVIADMTPDNPAGLLWESAVGVRVTGPGGVDSGLVDVKGPGEAWRDADVDYVLFDITGVVGDVFTVWGEHDARWDANALGGVFLDPAGNPDAPQIASFTATPDEIDTPDAAIQFDWEVEVPLDSLVLNPGNIDVLGDTDAGTGVGSTTLDPGPDESTVYSLEATRGGETGVAQVRVTLLPAEIVSFSADPNIIPPETAITLSWEVVPPITSLTLQPGDIDVLPDTDALGVGSITLDPGPSENTTYELVAVRGANATTTANTGVIVQIPGSGITILGVDETTNDAWRSTDVEKPFGDADNIYGTDGYLIAQFPDGDPQNLVEPPYATVQILGKAYEGLGAEAHQSAFDDVLQTGPGDVPDLVCGDYWANSGPTGTEDDFFVVTLTEDTSFRLGVITDTTPDNPAGLLFEAAVAVRVRGTNGADTGIVDAVGPNEEWRDADVDYVLFDISGSAGDEFTVSGIQDRRWEANALGGIFFDPSGGPSGPRFSVERSGDELLFRWNSAGGKLYNLRSDVPGATPPDPGGLANDPSEWPIFDGHQDIAATPPENTLMILYPADPTRLFVIEEFNAPPVSVFSEDFEAGQGAWTTGSEGDLGTLWALGTPANIGPSAAHSGTNCFGTNIDAAYTVNTAVWLRSPPIDLTTAGGATLNFWQFADIELMFDAGQVSVLDAADDSHIADIGPPLDGTTPDWEQVSRSIPAEALGKSVKIEFRLTTDNFDGSEFAGWYVDDVEVTVP